MNDQNTAELRQRGGLEKVLAAVQAGDLAGAIQLSETALANGLANPLLFKLRAIGREQQGRLEDAINDFRAALALFPDDFAALSALGLCLARSGRPRDGIAALDASISLNAGYAPAHSNRGWAMEAVGDRAAGRAAYQRAIEIDPSNLQALGGLAAIAARSGAGEEASAYAQRALAISPRDLLSNLAMAISEVARGAAVTAMERLQPLLADPGLPEHERAVALTVLGDALDSAGRFHEAFAAYASANSTLERLYARSSAADERPAGAALVHRLLDVFAQARLEDWRRGPAPNSAPPFRSHLFVVGFPRSGTTFVGQVLAAHPDTNVLDEQETLAEPARQFLSEPDRLHDFARMDADALEGFRQSYYRRVLEATNARGRVFVDKLPMNVLGLPLIAKMFPEARVLLMRRDPRDVVLSCFRRQFLVSGLSREFFTLEDAARFYDAVMRLTEIYLGKVELRTRVQRYEDLVEDFEGQSRAICSFIGLEWSAKLVDFGSAAQAREVATPSAGQVRRGLYSEGVGQWKHYRRELAPVAPILTPWIARFGYEPE